MATQIKNEPIDYQWSKHTEEYYYTEICTMSHVLHVRHGNINMSQVHASCHVYSTTIKQYTHTMISSCKNYANIQ